MSDRPSPRIDWGVFTPRLRTGDQVCVVHGRVDAIEAPIGIPICPHCEQSILTTRHDRRGVASWVEPRPPWCAATERHPMIGGRILVGWTACGCAHAVAGQGGHRTWLCRECVELGRDRQVAELCWPRCAR